MIISSIVIMMTIEDGVTMYIGTHMRNFRKIRADHYKCDEAGK